MRDQTIWTYGITDFTVLENEKIITVATAQEELNERDNDDFEITRLLPDGSYDITFGDSGFVFTDFFNAADYGCSIATLNDGSIIAGGYASDTDTTYIGVAKYNQNGVPDSSFGVNGKAVLPAPISFFDLKILVQQDGKIITAGTVLARFTANGIIDSTFGIAGKALDFDGALDAVFQDVRIVTMGQNNLARYNNNIVLPVSFTSFSANIQKTTVLLTWQTASEINNEYFSIERSGSGNNFSEISRVKSKGDAGSLQDYKFTDVQPLAGDNYYRLKQVDADGHYSYSPVEVVHFGLSTNYKLYPNPVKNILRLENLHENARVSIITQHGSVIAKKIATSNALDWNVKSLAPGVYYIRIEDDKKRTTLKFLKE